MATDINKVVYNDTTLIDITDADATYSDVLTGGTIKSRGNLSLTSGALKAKQLIATSSSSSAPSDSDARYPDALWIYYGTGANRSGS